MRHTLVDIAGGSFEKVLPMLGTAARICAIAAVLGAWPADAWAQPIDRHALVTRHQPVFRTLDVESPLSVGNGRFAFTVDATGLQTFAAAYDSTIPLCTMSEWGWHTAPNPSGWNIDTFHHTEFDSHARRVGYADVPGDGTPESNYLRENPHRLHLGRIGFRRTRADGRPAVPTDLTDVRQTLDLWNGVIVSHFRLDGQPVDVQTLCHPTHDLVAVRVVSPLVSQGRLGIEWQFPYGSSGTTAADWDHPAAHTTTLARPAPNQAAFDRQLDGDRYHAVAQWSPAATLNREAPHQFVLTPSDGSGTLELVCAFSPDAISGKLPSFADSLATARDHWHRFWSTGGAIDLSGSTDPRWRELERRIVLSQYLTAIQSAGRYPPAETGLTLNSWYGKFHLEMHWWHAVHFALWNRLDLFERSLGYYQAILPRAQATARRQGYDGARWPKMTDPSGAESPSSVGPFLIWQQPHPIYYAELCYRAHGDRATLEKYREVVFETARFMASYATWDEATGRYVLGPVLQCAQERFPKDATLNPTFELTYWRWGLETAQRWRERLGLPRDKHWDDVLAHLARPPVVDGKYAFTETTPDSYTHPRWNDDHPAVLAALGVLPGPGIDRPTMRRTLYWVRDRWNWPTTWGWDYPMVAMCAARLGEPELAVDALLLDTPKNVYRANGHNHQRPGLTVYLPGNGGLLTAVAMMAAGWDGAPKKHAPGFPDDGTWQVRYENLRPMP
jgi:hypothetical protein